MKKLKLFMAAMVAAITFVGMGGVSAAAQSVAGSTATPHEFTITREINNVTNKVTNTFGYTITADASNPATVENAPTTASVAFSNVTPDGSNKATAEGTVDFSSAVFTKNGDYVWTITETSTGDDANYPVDSTHTYKIKASVRNATEGGSPLSTDEGKKVTFFRLKSDGTKMNNTDPMLYTSEAQFKHIEIKKEVTGAMADVDQYFTVAVTVAGNPGDEYTISGQTASGAPTTCTVATGATSCTANIQLKHNETAIIGAANGVDQIPLGAAYSYSESTPREYTATNGSAESTISDTQSSNNHKIVNNYEGATVTGVFLRILPYIVIVAIAVAGVIYLVVRNKKQKEVEE